MVSAVMRTMCPIDIRVRAFLENARTVSGMLLSPANKRVSVTIAVRGMAMNTDSFLAFVKRT